jgi:outer membrane protein OmpA-like peptidoglycan-associated protein
MTTTSETSGQDRFVVGFALIAGLLFFGWLFQHQGWRVHSHPAAQVPDGAIAPLPRYDTDTIDDSAIIGPVPKFNAAAAAAGQEINLTPLSDRIDQTETDLVDSGHALDTRIVDLEKIHRRDFSSLTSEQSQQQAALQGEVVHSAALNADQSDRIARLEADRKDAEIEALKQQLAKLEGQLGSQSRLDAEQLRLLQLQIARIRSDTAQSRLFVTGDDLGGGRASQLFTRLKTLEMIQDLNIHSEYTKIGGELNAVPAVRIKYETAGSDVQEKDRALIEKLAAAAPEGTYFLVAGYADSTGEPEANRILSSKRATNAAEVLDRLSKANQTVRAVYLGQTKRFGPEAENRVVEIWAIEP